MEQLSSNFARGQAVETLRSIFQRNNARSIERAVFFSKHLFQEFADLPVQPEELIEFHHQYLYLLESVCESSYIGSTTAYFGEPTDNLFLVVDLLSALSLNVTVTNSERFIFDQFTFDVPRREIWNRKRKRLYLTEQQSNYFSILLHKRNIPVLFEELNNGNPLQAGVRQSLVESISSLRGLLTSLHCDISIRSVYGVGYVLELESNTTRTSR